MKKINELHVCLVPKPFQIPLPNFVSPMMARLVHDRTNISTLFILSVIKDLSNTHIHILLQQHSSPSPRVPYTFPPSTNLPLIIFTPPPHVETAVPLKPSPYVIFMIDPPGSFPLFYALA